MSGGRPHGRRWLCPPTSGGQLGLGRTSWGPRCPQLCTVVGIGTWSPEQLQRQHQVTSRLTCASQCFHKSQPTSTGPSFLPGSCVTALGLGWEGASLLCAPRQSFLGSTSAGVLEGSRVCWPHLVRAKKQEGSPGPRGRVRAGVKPRGFCRCSGVLPAGQLPGEGWPRARPTARGH